MAGAPWWEEFGAGPAPAATDTAPAAAPQVVPSPRPPRRPRGLQVTAAVLSVVLLALLGLLAARSLTGPAAAPGPEAVPGSGTPAAPPVTPVGSAAADPPAGTAAADAAATSELERLRERGLATHPPRGQWVAQLAAKSVGTTDPVQTAANGSSTFYAADILAQSREIASGVAGGDVFVLRSTDFGTGLVDARGNPYWATLAAGPFADSDDVRAWCDSMFARVPADERGNACLPKQLTPPAGR
ncbi:hypothetical protein [Kineococcus rhizosphaerae]|uniref:Uncharacterized protein n=1 Tax=Kineococcus rhizosphaerae TaxID=559628 RepID=A0A2T0R259_9ACTN|nr:hypothetical protein [Kineococcus rhizosphaerae]PRY13892.1 hypothetical protein CLV37_10710 [Kineococcus rhizosphaerae]